MKSVESAVNAQLRLNQYITNAKRLVINQRRLMNKHDVNEFETMLYQNDRYQSARKYDVILHEPKRGLKRERERENESNVQYNPSSPVVCFRMTNSVLSKYTHTQSTNGQEWSLVCEAIRIYAFPLSLILSLFFSWMLALFKHSCVWIYESTYRISSIS